MKITENYIEISCYDIHRILSFAMQEILCDHNNCKDKAVFIEEISTMREKYKIKYGELFEIRVVGDK